MNDNKRIAFNSIIIFIRLVITSLVGILASRIVLDALGASDYGLYNVVGGIVAILNVFNGAMLSTTYRFIASELGKNNNGNLNKVFNTSFLIHVAFAGAIFLLGFTVGEWYIDHYLNVAEGKLPDARFVFHVSLLTTAISTVLIPYQGLITAYEKFNVLALRDIVTKLLFLIVVSQVLYSNTNRLRLYSCIQLGYNLIYNGSFFIYCKNKYKDITAFYFYRDKELIKRMFSFASWTLFGAVASVGRTQGCVILINYFFGPLVNAAYAIAAQVDGFVHTFARSLNNAAIPQITKNYSGGNEERSMVLTSYISKYTFILMSLVSFPVLLEMDFLLDIWLKEVPSGASLFCKLMILGALLGTLGEGIPALVNATGDIKKYQIVYHSFTLLGLPISWCFFKLGYSQYSILVVYCLIYFFSTILRLYLLKHLYGFDITQIIKISYIPIVFMTLPLVFYSIVYRAPSTVFGHLMGLVGAEVFVMIVVWFIGIKKKERQMIYSFLHVK